MNTAVAFLVIKLLSSRRECGKKNNISTKTIKDQRAYEGLVLVSFPSLPFPLTTHSPFHAPFSATSLRLFGYAAVTPAFLLLTAPRFEAAAAKLVPQLTTTTTTPCHIYSTTTLPQLSSAVFPMFSPDSQPMRKFEAIYLLFAIAICRLPVPTLSSPLYRLLLPAFYFPMFWPNPLQLQIMAYVHYEH